MKPLILVMVSTLGTLLVCEAALRVLTPYGQHAAAISPHGGEIDPASAMTYISRMPAFSGTDPKWFLEDPEPLVRKPVDKEAQERFDDFRKRGLPGRPGLSIFNRRLVEYSGCSSTGPFRKFPPTVTVFDPPEPSIHPPYRFVTDTTTPEGLVTNQFGLRGPPLSLVKPPRTIRVAFVGASTTVNHHGFAFSYPERTVFWLNRFAAANHQDVRFEVLNAGREGIGSDDIAAIVRGEVMALDPDVVVYYEGANNFAAHALLVPQIAARSSLDPNDVMTAHKVPDGIRTHSALGELLDRVLNGFVAAGEPRKPAYRIEWPAGLDERRPNPDLEGLPLDLHRIVMNLDDIRRSLQVSHGELTLASFEWLASSGLSLSPVQHKYIYQELNTALWPFRYGDVRRLADFQNRVLRAYAESRRIPFLEVAEGMPQDPGLFSDAIHMTETGERVKAWVAFQKLLPYLQQQIHDRKVPRPGPSTGLPDVPDLSTREVSLCGIPAGAKYPVPDGFSLKNMSVSSIATLESSDPIKVLTSEKRYAYEVTFPLALPSSLAGNNYIRLRVHVLKGVIGLAVLDSKIGDFQGEKLIDASPAPQDVYVPVLIPATAKSLILRNLSAGQTHSEVILENAGLVTDKNPAR